MFRELRVISAMWVQYAIILIAISDTKYMLGYTASAIPYIKAFIYYVNRCRFEYVNMILCKAAHLHRHFFV